ncbi:hypothetical protein NXY40_21620 [Phocaeicola vulgatus]|nr:hypothetical protein [Phocaeicola vulgatus]
MGRAQDAQYPLMENGFDDYSVMFEAVDFYYDGVNQTKRYLDVTKDGVATVKNKLRTRFGAQKLMPATQLL